MGKGATSEAGKYLFRAANVWWRCIFLLPLVARCLDTIDVCIWHMFFIDFCCIEVCGNACCVAAVVKIEFF